MSKSSVTQSEFPPPAIDAGDLALSQAEMAGLGDTKAIAAMLARDALLLANVRDSVIVTDLDGTVTYWNEGATRLFGWEAEEMLGRPYVERFEDPSARTFVTEQIRTLGGDGAGWSMEWEDYRKDGSRVWVDARIVPVRDATGKSIALLGLAHDISKRKYAEAAVLEGEERLRVALEDSDRRRRLYETILSCTPDFVYVFSLDHRVLYANDALLAMWGHSLENTIGKTFLEIGYEPWHAELHSREIDQVRQTKQPIRGEVPFTGTQGRRIYDYIFVPVLSADGEVEAIAGTTRDITDRVHAEEALRASEAEFRTTFEGAGVGKAQARLDGRLLRVNPKLCELLGYTAEELLTLSIRDISHPDEREQDLEHFRKLASGAVPLYAIEKRYVRKNGETIWVRVTATLIRDREGLPLRASAVIEDITARKEAESALAQVSRRKDEFLATLAHELRNPLAPIRIGLQILGNTKEPEATDRVRTMMDRQLEHMVHLIDDLLDVSRISTGKIVLRRERVPLQTVLEVAVEASRPHLESARHVLFFDVPAEPIWLDADVTRLAQVVTNLLTNSAKYTPEGGQIELAASRDDDCAFIRVTDTGLGIPEEMLTEVFQMFTQVNRTLDRSQGGLGIGLALVKKLIEMHGGTITVSSLGHGKGSTFSVKLPVAAEQNNAVVAEVVPKNTEPSTAVRLKILIVDDNRDAADSLVMLLELSGHVARAVYSGTEAMEKLESFVPDIAFLDIGLPGMSGLELARYLRQDPRGSATILVAVTGWGSADDRQKTKEAGFDKHLTKPVGATELNNLLSQIIEAKITTK